MKTLVTYYEVESSQVCLLRSTDDSTSDRKTHKQMLMSSKPAKDLGNAVLSPDTR